MRQNPFVSILHFYEMCLNQTKGDKTFMETIKKKKRINPFRTVKWKHTCRYIGIK